MKEAPAVKLVISGSTKTFAVSPETIPVSMGAIRGLRLAPSGSTLATFGSTEMASGSTEIISVEPKASKNTTYLMYFSLFKVKIFLPYFE
ncbi:MAG: hypothetical protein WCH34_06120 [Bacteroidota bacterium]